MTKDKLISFLRSAVHIQDPKIEADKKYLAMSDEDLELYLTIALTRDFPKMKSIDVIPQDCVYPLILLAKKELYYALAVIEAPLYDMGAESNNYLKRDQRFQHYLKLIEAADKEYNQYNADSATGTGGVVTTYDVLLNNRYYTSNYKNLAVVPLVALQVDSINTDSVDVSWDSVVSNFAELSLYVSKNALYDPYNQVHPLDSLTPVLRCKTNTLDMCRVSGLQENTSYFICIVIENKSGLKGYSQIAVTTASKGSGE